MKHILGFVILMGLGSLNVYAETPAVVVTSVQGKAVLSAGDRDFEVVKGMAIPEGSVLKSDYQGIVDVSLHGNAGFRFLPDTRAVFTGTDPKKVKLKLETGNILARLKNKVDQDSTFEVETPAAVLAVRGTQFWGRVASPNEVSVTAFAVREGAVSVTAKSSGQTFTIKAGEAIELSEGQAEPVLREAAPAELDAIAGSETIQI